MNLKSHIYLSGDSHIVWAEFLQNHWEKTNRVCFFSSSQVAKKAPEIEKQQAKGHLQCCCCCSTWPTADVFIICAGFPSRFLMTGTCWKVQTRGGVNGGWLPQRRAVTVQTLPQGHTTTPASHSRSSSTIVGADSVFVWVWGVSSIKTVDFSCLCLLGAIWNLHKLLGKKNTKQSKEDEINFFLHLYSLLISDGETSFIYFVFFWCRDIF